MNTAITTTVHTNTVDMIFNAFFIGKLLFRDSADRKRLGIFRPLLFRIFPCSYRISLIIKRTRCTFPLSETQAIHLLRFPLTPGYPLVLLLLATVRKDVFSFVSCHAAVFTFGSIAGLAYNHPCGTLQTLQEAAGHPPLQVPFGPHLNSIFYIRISTQMISLSPTGNVGIPFVPFGRHAGIPTKHIRFLYIIFTEKKIATHCGFHNEWLLTHVIGIRQLHNLNYIVVPKARHNDTYTYLYC